MNNKIYFLKGLPASGKSTWARELVAKSDGKIKRVNKDDLRRMVDAGVWSKENEKIILYIRNDIINTCLSEGYSVIVDDTNFHKQHYDDIKRTADYWGVDIEIKEFNIGLDEAKKRNALRREEERVPDSVIENMYNKYIKPAEYTLNKANQDPDLPPAIICDLDGTLALLNGRDPYDAGSCANDLVNMEVFEVIHKFWDNAQIIFVSGRSSRYYEETRDWLITTLSPLLEESFQQLQLLMRAENDSRPDEVVKKKHYDNNIRNKYKVVFVLDDRDKVVKMWRSLGLTVFQVAEGNF